MSARFTPDAHWHNDPSIEGRRHVVLCTGTSSYGVLSYLTNDLARAFVAAGWTAEVLDLTRVAVPTELRRLVMEDRTAFFCGYSGYGANLAGAQGALVYDALGIPYVGLMLDSPTYYPARHEQASSQVILLHGDDGHHEVSEAISPSGSHRGLFRLAIAPWPEPPARLAQRKRTAVFASKGGDPRRYDAMLRTLLASRERQQVLALAEALRASNVPLRMWDAAQSLVPVTTRTPSGQPDARWHELVSHADHLARIRRATDVARAIRGLPVTFVGGDWSHVHDASAAASFLPGMPLPDVRRLMADSALVLNVQPGTTDSVHDRFLLGLHSGAAVVSDSNRFIDRHIGDEAFLPWDGDPRSLADRLADALRDIETPALQTIADRGFQRAQERFALDTLVAHVTTVVRHVRQGTALPHPDPTPVAVA